MISLFGSLKEPEKNDDEESKSGFFSRMKQAVSRTRESFSSKIEGIVALTRVVDEAAGEREFELALEFIERHQGAQGDRVRGILVPREIETCTVPLMRTRAGTLVPTVGEACVVVSWSVT